MATKQRTSAKRTVAGAAKVAATNGRHVHRPTETDPKKRAEAIRRAGSIIKTTAQIDTITLGRD